MKLVATFGTLPQGYPLLLVGDGGTAPSSGSGDFPEYPYCIPDGKGVWTCYRTAYEASTQTGDVTTHPSLPAGCLEYFS